MKIISNKKKLIKIIQSEKNLGFVPTMGAIHKAHTTMIKRCNSVCNKSLVTIFINKPQFNRKSDFRKYPRVLKKDISVLGDHGLLFPHNFLLKALILIFLLGPVG